MCFPLPNLTEIRARGAKPIGAFGLVVEALPTLTTVPIWLGLHSRVLLPCLTGRPVKYTHMPPQDRPFIRNTAWTDHVDVIMRRVTRWLIVMNIVLAIFTLFNTYIYPEHIYEAPEPTRVSEPVDQLSPYEI